MFYEFEVDVSSHKSYRIQVTQKHDLRNLIKYSLEHRDYILSWYNVCKTRHGHGP